MDDDTSACFIGELPDELLVAIVSQIQVERGFLPDPEAEEDRRCKNAVIVRSLHALTLCCWKLNAVATPFLYQCIIRTEQRLTLLLPTLLQNPKLGQHIQYFEATRFEIYDRELYPLSSLQGFSGPIRDKALKQARSAGWIVPAYDSEADITARSGQISRQIGPPQISETTRQWISKQYRLMYHSTLLILLSLAENLQDVAIEGNSFSNIINLGLNRYSRPGTFKRLWVWSKDRQDCGGYLLLYMCADYEESIETLPHYLRSLFLPEKVWSEFKSPCTMQEVSITAQDIHHGMIDDHLRGCDSLKDFTCRWQWTDKFSPRHSVELPILHRSLERFQDSLTRLTIDTTESAWRVNLDTFVPALGSLRDFKVLIYLDVSALVLWGDGDFWEPAPLSELLPESLEYLNLKTEWDEDIEDKLYQLSSECTVSLPRLKRVDCTWRPAPGFIADLLIDACHLAGVDLILDVEEAESSIQPSSG